MTQQSQRDLLSDVGQRRYDIELKRLQKQFGETIGRGKTEYLAIGWVKTEKKLAPANQRARMRDNALRASGFTMKPKVEIADLAT